MTDRTLTLDVPGLGAVPVRYSRSGSGTPLLLLHGGGGPGTVAPWGGRAADELPADVVVPVHPGFDLTERPDAVDSIRAVAAVHAALLDALDLTDVTVVGNSIGGWVAAELALLRSPRVGRLALVDSVGIEVEGHPIPDFFAMTPAELAARSYADPATYGLDPTTLPEAARRRMAANRAPLELYAGHAMSDPGLRARLADVAVPTLVVWGEADRIGDVEYGRVLAGAIPAARFEVIDEAGHLPQIERPEALTAAISGFLADTALAGR